ncbi:MAG: ATP-binding protein [Ilumatobacteraceae bacterium]|nr:ATP-binding protein [Ilumatobacteraceae bacterium]
MDATGARDVVGRVTEMATIQAVLGAGRRHGIALVGPAGVKKSRLAAAARDVAEAQGMGVVTAIATPAGATMEITVQGRSWLACLSYPSGSALWQTMNLITGRRQSTAWKAAFSELAAAA